MEKFRERTGDVQVVEEHLVNALSLCGYMLVGMYQETHGGTVHCSEPDPRPDYSYNSVSREHPTQETRTLFIMRQDEESAMLALSSRIEKLSGELEVAKKDVDAQADTFKKEKARGDRLQKLWDESKVITDQQRETIAELTRTKQKMEEDIGKIRQAIGTVKMAEILAVEE